MALINGKFKLYKTENLAEHLVKAWGRSEERAKLVESERGLITLNLTGKNLTINVEEVQKPHLVKLVVDEEVEEQMGDSVNKSLTTIDNNTLTIATKTASGETSIRAWTFSQDEAVMTLHKDGFIDAKCFYKRL